MGAKRYELTNHLGNVLAVVTDRKLGIGGATANYYQADVVAANDYYPFGMLMPQRNYTNSEYRYGFQGQERDDEVKGDGNSINFKYRMHDPRLGRFFAVDPLTAKYPSLTPYQFASNQPIHSREIEGLENSNDLNTALNNPEAVFGYGRPTNQENPGRKTDSNTPIRDAVSGVFIKGWNLFSNGASRVHNKLVESYSAGLGYVGYSFDMPTNVPSQTQFDNAVQTGDEFTFFSAFKTDVKALGNATPEVLAVVTEIVILEVVGETISSSAMGTEVEVVYRFDTRSFSEIKKAGGFEAKGFNMNLSEHVGAYNLLEESGYVSTTGSYESVIDFAKEYGAPGYIYKIVKPKNAIDVNYRLGNKSPHPQEQEFAVPLRIPKDNIIGIEKAPK